MTITELHDILAKHIEQGLGDTEIVVMESWSPRYYDEFTVSLSSLRDHYRRNSFSDSARPGGVRLIIHDMDSAEEKK